MLLIRCTAKLRKEMGLTEAELRDAADPGDAEFPIDIWYANLLRIERRKCLLFTNAASLFSFITFNAGKAKLKKLDAVFREGLEQAMKREGFSAREISQLMERYGNVVYSRTSSRSILASMNSIASMAEVYIRVEGGFEYLDPDDPGVINLKINRVPMSALDAVFPIEAFASSLNTDREALLERRISNAAGSGAVYQLRMTLIGSDPLIWRRVLVRDITLARLSDFLIAVMGWQNYHLHIFTVGDERYSDPDPEWCDPQLKDERSVKLSDIVASGKSSFVFEYDMGDSWQHEVVIERIGHPEEGRRYPVCVDGAFACPPEDVGGIGGFYEFIEAVADPAHPQHGHMIAWAGGGFDPEAFDLDKINQALIASVLQDAYWELI